MTIGSPRLVFIPDIISDVFDFVRLDRPNRAKKQLEQKEDCHSLHEVVNIDDGCGGDETGIEATVSFERKASSRSSFLLSVKTAQCSVLLVDLGSDALRPSRALGLSMPIASVSETIVFGGSFDAKVTMASCKETGAVVEMDAQLHGDALEAYTAYGRELHGAVQILDPTKVSFYANTKSSLIDGMATDVRFAIIEPIDMTLSMQNIALINAITASSSDCFAGEDIERDPKKQIMSQEETERVEKLATVLELPVLDSYSTQESSVSTDDSSIALSSHGVALSTRNDVTVKITTPEMKFTVINDMQGVDDALLRFNFRNFVACGRTGYVNRDSSDASFSSFDFNLHTSVLADYFDSSTNTWKVLLVSPWEVSMKGNRGENVRFQSMRPSTTVDVESFQCHLSFSEQFLMSVASAKQMWNVYSTASASAFDSEDESSKESKNMRRSLAASAARTFVSSLPYAIDNHAGVDLKLVIDGQTSEQRSFRSGSIEYFRFEPPPETGTGGKRLYGQDVKFDKNVTLLIGDQSIRISCIDAQLGVPMISHKLEDNLLIMTDVVKEGKTTVRIPFFSCS